MRGMTMRTLLRNTRQRLARRLTSILHDLITLGVDLPPPEHEAEVISLAAHRKQKVRAA